MHRKLQAFVLSICILQLRSDTADDTQAALEHTSQALSIVAFAYRNVAGRLNVIAEIGLLVRDLVGMSKSPNEEIIERLKLLEKHIGHMSQNITNQMNDLKSVIVEHKFYTKSAVVASKLTKLMRDTINGTDKDFVAFLRDEVTRDPPYTKALTIISMLEIDETSPLRVAMKHDTLKRKTTFEKWKRIIDGVLAQFLYVETYINGLFWGKNMIRPNRLKYHISQFNKKMAVWQKEYESDYWPGVVHHIVRDRCREAKGFIQRANCSQLELQKVMTKDAFFVMVHKIGAEIVLYRNVENQTLILNYLKGYEIIVYRSKKYRSVKQRFYNSLHRWELERAIISLRDESCNPHNHLNLTKELMGYQFRRAGLTGMVDRLEDFKIITTATNKPVFFAKIPPDECRNISMFSKRYMVFAAFK